MSYYEKNREKVLAQQKEYYIKNKEKILERAKKRRMSLNPDERKRRRRKRYEKQKEHIQTQNIVKTYGENGLIILKNKNGVCQKCGMKGIYGRKTKEILIHHIDLNKKNNKLDNLMVLCSSCHRKLHCKLQNKAIKIMPYEQIKRWTDLFLGQKCFKVCCFLVTVITKLL